MTPFSEAAREVFLRLIRSEDDPDERAIRAEIAHGRGLITDADLETFLTALEAA